MWDSNGVSTPVNSGRVNWWGRSEDWEDKLGFRGPKDVESPNLGWNRLEAVVNGASLQYYVNGQLVFEATNSSLTEGKIMIQSEGAEIYFRRIDLEPAQVVTPVWIGAFRSPRRPSESFLPSPSNLTSSGTPPPSPSRPSRSAVPAR